MGVEKAAPTNLNVLVLNTDLPIFPGGGGVEFLTMKYLAALAHKVGIVSMAHTRSDLNRSRPLVDAGVDLYLWHSPWLDGVPAPSRQSRVARAVHRGLLRLIEIARIRRDRPVDTQVTDAAFSNMAPGVISALSERAWPVVAIVQSNAAAMIDYIPRPLVSVLVMHDIRARLYARRAAAARSVFERWRHQAEARRYLRFERARSRQFDLVVTVSDEDARWVREHYQPARVFALPLPVDTNHFAPSPVTTPRGNRIIFTGHLSHPPNVDAAVYFATEVFPRVRAKTPSAEFHIVGKTPVAAVKALADLPAVSLFADVPDIRTHIAEAAVVVAPLRYGSGSRQKILEAWSMEKCVVATSVGAEGLHYDPAVNIIVADGTDDLAGAVSEALSNGDVSARVGRAGRAVACRDHDPARLAERYFTELEHVRAEKAARDVPMRVLLDMRWMVPGLAGGIENLARSFVEQLALLDGDNDYTVLVPAQCRHDFDLRGRPNIRTVSIDSARELARRAWTSLTRNISRRLRLHDCRTPEVQNLQWLHDLGVEIAYSFPGFIHPQLYPLRQVLIVPDIQHEYLPQFFSAEGLEERRRLYTGSIQRADHLCAISEFTRQTLIDKLGVPPTKVTTVHLAPDAIFAPRAVDDPEDGCVLTRHGLQRGTYLYFPAHTWHHKNHRVAIEALRILRDRYGDARLLVCSGGPREAQPAIDAQISTAGLEQQVRFLGYCPREDVPALYRGAASLIFPSLFEGFGMPVLEAMASGCPVVCSNTTSMPEIAGDAALLVDPEDPEAVAAALHRVLTDGDLRRDLVAKGVRQAARFSWRRHTLESLAVLHRVHAQMRTLVSEHGDGALAEAGVSSNAWTRATGQGDDQPIATSRHQSTASSSSGGNVASGATLRVNRRPKAARLIRRGRELYRARKRVRGVTMAATGAVLAPGVAADVGVAVMKPALKKLRPRLRLRRFWRHRARPETDAWLGHTDLHPDSWAGPDLVTNIDIDSSQTAVVLTGAIMDCRTRREVRLTAFLDGRSLGVRSTGPHGDFSVDWTIAGTPAGRHQLRITANTFLVPHDHFGNQDYRPLSYRVIRLEASDTSSGAS